MWIGQLQAARQIAVAKEEEPNPRPGEVRVRLHQVGICGSDVHLYLGHRKVSYPQVIGHEGVGYIDKIGEGGPSERLGERVVIEPNFPCLKCSTCLRGQGNICPQKGVLGLNRAGCFAEYVLVPEAFAHRLPEEVADAEIVLLGLSEQEATFQPLKTVRKGISIVPSLIYQHPFDFQRVIQLIVTKIIEPQFIIYCLRRPTCSPTTDSPQNQPPSFLEPHRG